MPEKGLLDLWVLHISDGNLSIPLLLHVRLLQRHICKYLLHLVELLSNECQYSGLEQELLELDKHPSLFETLRLYTLIVNVLKLLQVGILEDRLNLRVNQVIEILARGFLESLQILTGLCEVGVSELVISEDLLKSLIEGFVSTFLLFCLEEMLSCTLNGKCSISDVNAMLSESLSELGIKVVADLRLRGRLLVDPEADLIGKLLIVEASGQ